MDATSELVRQLTSVVDAYANAVRVADEAGRDLDEPTKRRFRARALAAIERAALPASIYTAQTEEVLRGLQSWTDPGELVGIVQALRDDYSDGAMVRVAELIHAELFGERPCGVSIVAVLARCARGLADVAMPRDG